MYFLEVRQQADRAASALCASVQPLCRRVFDVRTQRPCLSFDCLVCYSNVCSTRVQRSSNSRRHLSSFASLSSFIFHLSQRNKPPERFDLTQALIVRYITVAICFILKLMHDARQSNECKQVQLNKVYTHKTEKDKKVSK